MKIVLLGYMASGKSTIGKILAEKLNLPFIDLDNYIEEKEEKTISELFKAKGEIYFRKQEHFYLKELLAKDESFVLSLGGGTPCYAGNMDVLATYKNAKTVYLKASITTITNRLMLAKEARPLVANLEKEQLTEFIAKHLFERSYFYNKAIHVLTTDNKDKEQLALELKVLLS